MNIEDLFINDGDDILKVTKERLESAKRMYAY